jgi:hypothetical protein
LRGNTSGASSGVCVVCDGCAGWGLGAGRVSIKGKDQKPDIARKNTPDFVLHFVLHRYEKPGKKQKIQPSTRKPETSKNPLKLLDF